MHDNHAHAVSTRSSAKAYYVCFCSAPMALSNQSSSNADILPIKACTPVAWAYTAAYARHEIQPYLVDVGGD